MTKITKVFRFLFRWRAGEQVLPSMDVYYVHIECEDKSRIKLMNIIHIAMVVVCVLADGSRRMKCERRSMHINCSLHIPLV